MCTLWAISADRKSTPAAMAAAAAAARAGRGPAAAGGSGGGQGGRRCRRRGACPRLRGREAHDLLDASQARRLGPLQGPGPARTPAARAQRRPGGRLTYHHRLRSLLRSIQAPGSGRRLRVCSGREKAWGGATEALPGPRIKIGLAHSCTPARIAGEGRPGASAFRHGAGPSPASLRCGLPNVRDRIPADNRQPH